MAKSAEATPRLSSVTARLRPELACAGIFCRERSMLLILHPNTDETSEEYRKTFEFLRTLPRIETRTHVVQGQQQRAYR